MSTAEMHLRQAKRQQTLAEKAAAAENDPRLPVRAFVRTSLKNPDNVYHGRVGQIHSHNEGEIGVKFSAEGKPVWFRPAELSRSGAVKPKGWDDVAPIARKA